MAKFNIHSGTMSQRIDKTAARRAAQRALTVWIEQAITPCAMPGRRQRDGSVRVSFVTRTEDECGEARWSPRRPFVVELYRQEWVTTNRGNLGGHDEDVFVRTVDLPEQVLASLVESL